MIIKKYVVSTMNEAMMKINEEMGKDAIIISQRKVKKGGFLGLFSKKLIEVTATASSKEENEENNKEFKDIKNSIKELNNNLNNKNVFHDEFYKSLRKATNSNLEAKNEENVKPIIEPELELDEDIEKHKLLKEMKEMKKMLKNISNDGKIKEESLIKKLIEKDINENLAKNISKKVENIEENIEVKEKLKIVMENMIKVSNDNIGKITALIGPTGVGKTTTIAKLAGRISLVDKKKVGLITIDTYRIGAVEQLKTYADIMNIPFRVVFSLKEMEKAVSDLKDCDVILIDTTGRSSKKVMQISELRAFINKVSPDNIHLVVSSTTKNRDIETIINGYKVLEYDDVIMTKLDETTTYGSILNICDISEKPISFITIGQDVPDDIKEATKDELIELILGDKNLC
ncbi:flagellar biosynthesis protein FlhF [Clostridium oceanicum]|uniref:Flagellar biosynthesis protein FlhF n=1 Tax=Clostridium oceanicum TaxID=1543 RepID=A0ABP3V5Q9_9CLOT